MQNMDLRFETYDHIDFDTWSALWADYIGPSAALVHGSVHQHTFSRIRHADTGLLGLLAVTDRPVGFAHYYFHPSSYSLTDACTLEDLYVAPTARGQGVGRALIQQVAARAHEAHAPALHWKTRATNQAAQALYERLATRTEFVCFRMAL